MEKSMYEDETEMEDLAMVGGAKEKAARMKREKERKKIRELKKLAGMDPWENEDELMIGEAGDTLVNMLKFIKDPMVKGKLTKAQFKVANNCLIDVISVFEELEMAEDEKLMKKV